MTPDDFHSAINAAVAEKSQFSWIQLSIFAIICGLTAYFAAYLKRRGEDRAAKESFAAIQRQLRLTTSDTEEIKASIAQSTWLNQTRWSSREKFYSGMIYNLWQIENSLSDMSEYYEDPSSQYGHDFVESDAFRALRKKEAEHKLLLRDSLGNAAIHLSAESMSTVDDLFRALWDVTEDSSDGEEYVGRALSLVTGARKAVQREARAELFGIR